MKIAIMNFYSGQVHRGGESFVHELATHLSKKHDVDVYQQGSVQKDARYNIKRIPIKVNWKRKSSFGLRRRFFIDYWSITVARFTLKTIPSILRKRYCLVMPLNGGWQVALVRIVTWLYGGKMVISGQSGIGWDDRNNLWSFPDMFVAITKAAKEWAEKANPFVRVKYIPNGVNLDKFTPKGKKFKTKLKSPIVLCVGALTKYKRIDLVIGAVSKLQGVSLLVVGDGELREDLQKMGKDLLGNRFELVNLSYDRMPEVYRACDVFTLVPESFEAFGIVFLEAMATNLPVVTIDDVQRKEIVGDAGKFINPSDLVAYKNALENVLSTNWGNKPIRQSAKFSWKVIAKKYESIFLSVI